MMNKLWLLLGFCILMVYPVSAFYCYQESANVSNQTGLDGSCGLNYSGSYNFTTGSVSRWNGSTSNLSDGNYSTFTNVNTSQGISSMMTINYVIPVGAKSSTSLWYFKSGATLQNFTVSTGWSGDNSCFSWAKNNNNGKLKLVVVGDTQFGFTAYCEDGSGGSGSAVNYISGFGDGSFSFFDEAMIWDMIPVLNISLFDEQTNASINQQVNISFNDFTNPNTFSASTSSGGYLASINNSDIYFITFTSQNYSTRGYFFNMSGSNQTNFLNVYLLKNSIAQNFSMCFYDSNGLVIPNLPVSQSVLFSSNYSIVQSFYTNIQGKLYFSFNPSSSYLYNYSTSRYIVTPFVLNPPHNDVVQADGCNYDIILQYLVPPISNGVVNVSGVSSWSNFTQLLTFNYSSSDSSLINYSYTVSKVVNGQNFVICSGSSTNIFDSFTCNLAGYHDFVFVQGVANNSIVFYGSYVDIGKLPTLFDNLNQYDAAYLSGFIMLIIVLAGIIFGFFGTLIMGFVGLWIINALNLLTPLTTTLIVVDMIVMVVIGVAIQRQ